MSLATAIVDAEFLAGCRDRGMRQCDIAAELGRSRQWVIRTARRLGVKFVHNKIKYQVNEALLTTWSAQSAYLLGLLMADGCVNIQRPPRRKPRYRLTFQVAMKDVELARYVRDCLSPTRPVRENVVRRRKGKTFLVAALDITLTKDCFKYLGSLGLVSRKSGRERIPEQLPAHLTWDFVLGLFDGDGSVYKRRGKDAGGYDWFICSASKFLVKQLAWLIPWGKVKHSRDMWLLTVRDKIGIRKIRRLVYPAAFSLQRKREIMESV